MYYLITQQDETGRTFLAVDCEKWDAGTMTGRRFSGKYNTKSDAIRQAATEAMSHTRKATKPKSKYIYTVTKISNGYHVKKEQKP